MVVEGKPGVMCQVPGAGDWLLGKRSSRSSSPFPGFLAFCSLPAVCWSSPARFSRLARPRRGGTTDHFAPKGTPTSPLLALRWLPCLSTSLLANPPPHCLLLFFLFRRQDLIDLLAGGLADLGGFRARLPLWERRIRSKIFKLFVPVLEDGPDFCLLVVRQV